MQPHAQPIPQCAEFTSELCAETWVVKDGTVTALLKGVRIQGQGEEHSEQVQAQLAEALKEKAKLKSEKAVALAEKKAKKEEERRRKFAKKVLVSFPSLIFSRELKTTFRLTKPRRRRSAAARSAGRCLFTSFLVYSCGAAYVIVSHEARGKRKSAVASMPRR